MNKILFLLFLIFTRTFCKGIISLKLEQINNYQSLSQQKIHSSIREPILNAQSQFLWTQTILEDTPEVPITNIFKQQYYVQIQVGTPPQNFILEVDTGSSDFWISSIDCQTAGCKKHNRFNPRNSSTFLSTQKAFKIHYLGGDTSGTIVKDTVKMGNLQLANFTFGISNSTSTLFDKVKFDGVLGLAFQSISQIKGPTFIDCLYAQGLIEQNSFSIYLSPNQDNSDSELILGGINPKYAASEFKYYPIYSQLQFVLQGNYISFNNNQINVNTVIIDSGTSTISGDENVLGPIASYFPSQIDCQNISGYPSLIINYNGDDYELLPEDYIYSYTYLGVLNCRLGIKFFQLRNPGQIILGDTFLRRYYTLFDKQNNRVGFAKAVRPNKTQQS